jgi:hypothetical protein
MKASDVKIGHVYLVKVSGKLARVRIDRDVPYPLKGWWGTNEATGRDVRIKTAGRLRLDLTNSRSDLRATVNQVISDQGTKKGWY